MRSNGRQPLGAGRSRKKCWAWSQVQGMVHDLQGAVDGAFHPVPTATQLIDPAYATLE